MSADPATLRRGPVRRYHVHIGGGGGGWQHIGSTSGVAFAYDDRSDLPRFVGPLRGRSVSMTLTGKAMYSLRRVFWPSLEWSQPPPLAIDGHAYRRRTRRRRP